jgi:hypothetical protein
MRFVRENSLSIFFLAIWSYSGSATRTRTAIDCASQLRGRLRRPACAPRRVRAAARIGAGTRG